MLRLSIVFGNNIQGYYLGPWQHVQHLAKVCEVHQGIVV